tara:strand:+ start:54 stop:734 length:681 start_codon:yes stop_codon:yes gene_type:complete
MPYQLYITLLLLFLINFYGFLYSYIITTKEYFKDSKIQKNRFIGLDTIKKRSPLILFNITVLMILTSLGLIYFKNFFISNYSSLSIEILKLCVVLLIDDLFFYFLHRSMHENKYLYKKIHKIHHRANTPIPIDYIYVHPFEWLSGFVGPFIGMIIIGGISFYTFWAYLIIRNIHELHIHSGLRTSFLLSFIPFYGLNEHHDMHHFKRDGNYASTFIFLDKLFKTKI